MLGLLKSLVIKILLLQSTFTVYMYTVILNVFDKVGVNDYSTEYSIGATDRQEIQM